MTAFNNIWIHAFRSVVLNGGESLWSGGADSERIRISREEDIYKQDILKLETDLT